MNATKISPMQKRVLQGLRAGAMDSLQIAQRFGDNSEIGQLIKKGYARIQETKVREGMTGKQKMMANQTKLGFTSEAAY